MTLPAITSATTVLFVLFASPVSSALSLGPAALGDRAIVITADDSPAVAASPALASEMPRSSAAHITDDLHPGGTSSPEHGDDGFQRYFERHYRVHAASEATNHHYFEVY